MKALKGADLRQAEFLHRFARVHQFAGPASIAPLMLFDLT